MTASVEFAATERASRMRAPDFFIVGHAKCGTTALYAMLRDHPQIYLPSLKEPRFLATDLRYTSPPKDGRLPETIEEYLTLFADALPQQRVGEASTMYLWSHDAPRHIAELQPAARTIAILREPASFLYTLHNHLLLHHVETEKDFQTALSLEEDRREGRSVPRESHWPQALMYSDRVHYVEQLRRYETTLSREQMLTLIYDDLRRDNEATVRTVLRFLDVDDARPVAAVEANTTRSRVRSVRLDAAIRELYSGRRPWSRAVKTAVRALTTERIRTSALPALRRRVVHARPQPPDEAFLLELRRRFKGEVVALSEYLDRDLVALWGYDRLG